MPISAVAGKLSAHELQPRRVSPLAYSSYECNTVLACGFDRI